MTRPIAPHRIAQALRDGRAANDIAPVSHSGSDLLADQGVPPRKSAVPFIYRVFEWLWLLSTLSFAVYFALYFAVYFALQFARVVF